MKKDKLVKGLLTIIIISLPGFYLLLRTGGVEASVPTARIHDDVRAEVNAPVAGTDGDMAALSARLPGNISQKAFRCLAQAVYFEARSEPFEGQVAVAYVVLNRVQDKHYPDTICGVVFQNEKQRYRCQFSFACDGRSDYPYEKSAWNMARRVAARTLLNSMSDFTARSTHYHAEYVHPRWAEYLQPTLQVGRHIFYREDL